MKAAVIYNAGESVQYADVAEPVVKNNDEILITVKAAAIKHFDKGVASGRHYSSTEKSAARIIGGDGVGILPGGTRVFAVGEGMVAEKAIIEKDRMVVLPVGIDDVTAAALPNAVAGSAMAIKFRAALQQGENVLINGATGFTGRMAVQLAKHYGAKKVMATGRNQQSLAELLQLGADEIISTQQKDEQFIAAIQAQHAAAPIDVVIDYLWGHTAELVLSSLKGKGGFTHKTRFVSVGSVTGDTIRLSAENLRSADIQLCGSGLGSWTKQEIRQLFTEILPEIFTLAAAGNIKIETETVELKDIETIWQISLAGGKRLVVKI
ncbi:MAG TPA: zinc-binding alcohol dehydrogenase family protein [Chitinophagaceae bacterium]|nr:zinc-binding alcohol dehydrogenase family protein [Chitinophagaceae bacterium]